MAVRPGLINSPAIPGRDLWISVTLQIPSYSRAMMVSDASCAAGWRKELGQHRRPARYRTALGAGGLSMALGLQVGSNGTILARQPMEATAWMTSSGVNNLSKYGWFLRLEVQDLQSGKQCSWLVTDKWWEHQLDLRPQDFITRLQPGYAYSAWMINGFVPVQTSAGSHRTNRWQSTSVLVHRQHCSALGYRLFGSGLTDSWFWPFAPPMVVMFGFPYVQSACNRTSHSVDISSGEAYICTHFEDIFSSFQTCQYQWLAMDSIEILPNPTQDYINLDILDRLQGDLFSISILDEISDISGTPRVRFIQIWADFCKATGTRQLHAQSLWTKNNSYHSLSNWYNINLFIQYQLFIVQTKNQLDLLFCQPPSSQVTATGIPLVRLAYITSQWMSGKMVVAWKADRGSWKDGVEMPKIHAADDRKYHYADGFMQATLSTGRSPISLLRLYLLRVQPSWRCTWIISLLRNLYGQPLYLLDLPSRIPHGGMVYMACLYSFTVVVQLIGGRELKSTIISLVSHWWNKYSWWLQGSIYFCDITRRYLDSPRFICDGIFCHSIRHFITSPLSVRNE